MTTPLCTLDLARMRRDRVDKLRAAMTAAGVDTLVLCNEANVSYATGARVARVRSRARRRGGARSPSCERDDPWPHLYTEFPEGSPSDLPSDHLHPAIEVEAAGGAAELVGHAPRRPARARRRAVPAVAGAQRPRRRRRRARCSPPPSSRRPSTSSSASARRRRSTSGRCAPCARPRSPACSRPISRACSSARSPSSARRRTPSTRCSR